MDRSGEQDQDQVVAPVALMSPPPPPHFSSPPPRRPRLIFSWFAGLAAVLMLVLLVRSLAAYHVAPLGIVPRPTSTPTLAPTAADAVNQGMIYSQYTLMSIAMLSASDVWAVGSDFNKSSQSAHTSVFLHFDGTTWKRVRTSFDYSMASISMLSSSDGWAVGSNVILHYTGNQWTVHTIDHSGQYETLEAITMVSAAEGWAVGSAGDGQTTGSVVLHYTHGRWTRITIPQDTGLTYLRAISMVSPDEGWAVGSYYANGEANVALHYSHGMWKRADVGVSGPLYGISALSPDDVWAVGASNPGTGPGFIMHYSHGVWSNVPSPTPNIVHAITMHSPTDGWIAGDGAAILHYDGARWTQVSPTIHHVGLLSVSVLADEGWATGTNVLLRLHNGVWAPYILNVVDA